MTEISRSDDFVYFDFTCPGCGAHGRLGVDTSEDTPELVKLDPIVRCPEECGSAFVLWRPDGKHYALKCVVQRCG